MTNALTGWETKTQEPLPFLEFKQERDRAEEVKQGTRVLVVLGNPPYNGRAGKAFGDSVVVGEESGLMEVYRTVKGVRKPEGQGLNDLYTRFFRIAERRVVEMTGQGVVCFISNYSWLDGLSFTGMREHYLGAFDTIRIDNLHGDRIISEYAPDGRTSETVFAIQGQSPGIRIGTAITLLSKSGSVADGNGNRRILYRDFQQARAEERRAALLDSLDAPAMDSGYTDFQPNRDIGLPFKPMAVNPSWTEWQSLPNLFPTSFPGVKTSRDSFLIDVDLDRLTARVDDYFNANLTHEDITRQHPSVMASTGRFDARGVRETLLQRGLQEDGFVQHAYRPFDNRWLYWEGDTKLLDEKRADYKQHIFEGNLWLGSNKREIDNEFSHGTLIRDLGNWKLGNWGIHFFPAWLRDEGLALDGGGAQRRPNLSAAAQRYLDRLGLGVEDLFHHVLAVLHDPAYREANAGALRMEWPRIPLPGWPGGDAPGAADELRASAQRGRELAALLDPETPVAGVTAGTLRPELAAIAGPATVNERNMTSEDRVLTADWGRLGNGGVVMPRKGRAVERDYTVAERNALGEVAIALGETTYDIYLNDNAFWSNIPEAVWNYKLGGYQVLKKWLSYREKDVLGRNLSRGEVNHFSDTARRIAAILNLTESAGLTAS